MPPSAMLPILLVKETGALAGDLIQEVLVNVASDEGCGAGARDTRTSAVLGERQSKHFQSSVRLARWVAHEFFRQ